MSNQARNLTYKLSGFFLICLFSLIPNYSFAGNCWLCQYQPRYHTYSCSSGNDAGWYNCTPYIDHCDISMECSPNQTLAMKQGVNGKVCNPAKAPVSGSEPKNEFHTPNQIFMAKQTSAEEFINGMISKESDFKAYQLHLLMSNEESDPKWSKSTQELIKESLSNLPHGLNSRLIFLDVECRSTICELRAAGMHLNDDQVTSDVREWQEALHNAMSTKEWINKDLDPSVNTNLIGSTPDGRSIFVSFFIRNTKKASTPATP